MTQEKFTGLLDWTGRPLKLVRRPTEPARRAMRASYDAADTNDGNARLWETADGLSGRAANSPDVRRKLRERARLEFDNGGNCKGAIETRTHDTIGTGPRLQLSLGDAGLTTAARKVERLFTAWCRNRVVDYTDKLRLLDESATRDGEAFLRFRTNPASTDPVQLDVQVIETEVCCTPEASNWKDPVAIDGIEFDKFGNPSWYHFLKQHPGDLTWVPNLDYERVNAVQVCHWFRSSRPSEVRGVPRITPGLPLIAQIRSYARSVLGAARLAAVLAGVMRTTLAPDGGPASVAAYDVVPFEHEALLTLPEGWGIDQVRAEQPTTSYKDFRETSLTEFGRSIHAPRNIVTGDSSPYNYSSARLDHLIYRGSIKVERARLRVRVLDPTFVAWLVEALLIPGYLPADLPPITEWKWNWRFDGFPSIDPVKDATASEINLRTGLTTYTDELAEQGKDWEEHFEQLARERKRAKELGIEDLLWPDQTAQSADRQGRLVAEREPPRPPADDGSDETVLDEEEVYA